MAFTGEYTNLDACRICSKKKSESSYFYHLSPRISIAKLFENKVLAKIMRFLPRRSPHTDKLRDVFDGENYKALSNEVIKCRDGPGSEFHPQPDGVKHFEHSDDSIQLVLSINSDITNVLSFGHKEVIVFTATIHNLPLSIRSSRRFILPLMSIPKIKRKNAFGQDTDFGSVLVPIVEDLKDLGMQGMKVYDAYTQSEITVRCICPYFSGDIPDVNNISGYCSHNATMPCRFCKLLRISKSLTTFLFMNPGRNPNVPRDRTWFESIVTKFRDFFLFSKKVLTEEEKAQPEIKQEIAQHLQDQKNLSSREGIRFYSPIFDLFSTVPPFCFPLDAMHLFLENACKSMFSYFYDEQALSLLPPDDMATLKETIIKTRAFDGWCSEKLDPEKFIVNSTFAGMKSNQFLALLDLFPILYMEIKASREALLVFLFLSTICKALLAQEIDSGFLPSYDNMIRMTVFLYETVFVGANTDNGKYMPTLTFIRLRI